METRLCSKCKVVPLGERKHHYCFECTREFEAKRRSTARFSRCSDCGVIFPELSKNHRCTPCSTAYTRQHREKNRALHRVYWTNAHARKKEQRNAWRRAPEQKARFNARQKERYAENPDYWIDKEHRRRALKMGAVVSRADLKEIAARSNNRCVICGVEPKGRARQYDHIIPLTRGGAHAAENLQLLCGSCNSRKHDRLMSELDWLKGGDPNGPID